jgi:hypothetical protein
MTEFRTKKELSIHNCILGLVNVIITTHLKEFLNSFQVKDVSEALNYCNKYHVQGSNVYTMLYQLLVCPPDALALESMYVSHVNAHTPISPDISVALKLLEDHGHKVDLDVVLTSTPSSVPLSLLTPYLEATLGQRVCISLLY